MGKILAVLSLIVASLVGLADPVAASECVVDSAGDANVVYGITSLVAPPVPAVAPNDPVADLTGVCVTVTDTHLTVRFDLADDTAPSTIGRQFSASLENYSGCFDLVVKYARGVGLDSATVSTSQPDGCEPPPWFIGFSLPVSGAVHGHTPGSKQFWVTVSHSDIAAAVMPYTGYDPGPGYFFDSAMTSFENPLQNREPAIDRIGF